MAEISTENVDLERENAESDFVSVKTKSRKRKRVEESSKTEMDTTEIQPPSHKRPNFPPISGDKLAISDLYQKKENTKRKVKSVLHIENGKTDLRKVAVPSHRYGPLKDNWLKIFTPIVEHLHLQVRFNLKTRNVEIKTCKDTRDIGALQKAADFVRAFTLGFEVDDSLALVRLDDLYLESFQITDVKPLKGDHLARAIGRLAGKNGKTKFTIENVTKTRIVLADSKIHILGSFQNIKIARTAVCNLILGSPPSKVYGTMRTIATRSAERF